MFNFIHYCGDKTQKTNLHLSRKRINLSLGRKSASFFRDVDKSTCDVREKKCFFRQTGMGNNFLNINGLKACPAYFFMLSRSFLYGHLFNANVALKASSILSGEWNAKSAILLFSFSPT